MNFFKSFLLFFLMILGSGMSIAQIKFQRTFGKDGYENDFVLGTTPDGEYFFGGYVDSYGSGGNDGVIMKADTNGNIKWTKTYGGPGNELMLEGRLTSEGGFIFTGYTDGYGAGNKDAFLIKTNGEGNIEWSKTYGTSLAEEGFQVIETTHNGSRAYLLSGYANNLATGNDLMLIKTDSIGNVIWSKSYGSSGTDQGLYALQVPGSGGTIDYVVAGRTTSFGLGNYELYLIKVTGDAGNLIYEKTFGTTALDEARTVISDGNGGYTVAGNSEGAVLLNLTSGGTVNWAKKMAIPDFFGCQSVDTIPGAYVMTGYFIGTGFQGFVFKTDRNGNFKWAKNYGGDSNDGATIIKGTSDGGFVMLGNSRSYKSTYSPPPSPGTDYFLVKADSSGNAGCYNGTLSPTLSSWSYTSTSSASTVADLTISVSSDVFPAPVNHCVFMAEPQVCNNPLLGDTSLVNVLHDETDFPVPVATTPEGTHLCTGSTLTLSTQIEYDKYEWTRVTSGTIAGNSRNLILAEGGTYRVKVWEMGCEGVSSEITITESSFPIVEATGDTACKGTAAHLTVSSTPGAIYQWDSNGDGTTDITTTSPFLDHIYATSGARTVIVKVVTPEGCIDADTITASIWDTPSVSSVSKTDVNCPDQYAPGIGWYNNGTMDITASGGTGTLEYSVNNVTWQAGDSFDSLAIGNHTAWVKDANGCKASGSASILYEGPVISEICADKANCSPGGTTRIKFTVTRIDPASACTFDYKIRNSSGSIVYTGSAVFNLEETEDVSGLAAGNYTFLLLPTTLCNACDTILKSFSVGAPPVIVSSVSNLNNPSATNLFYTCGLSDGLKMTFKVSATFNASCAASGRTYADSLFKWDEGTEEYIYDNKTYSGASDTVSFQLLQGKYKFTSTVSPYGCSASDFYFEILPTTLEINIIAKDPVCVGSTGSASAIILSGQAPVSYYWFRAGDPDTLSLSYDVTGLLAGDHQLEVYDGRGCFRTDTFSITDPPAMDEPELNIGTCDATASMTDNNRGPFTFHWIFRDIESIEVADTAYFTQHPDSTIRYITVIDTIDKEVFTETIFTPTGLDFISDPKAADSTFLFETGIYFVRVKDAYGCETVSDIDSIVPPAVSRTYHICFKWKGVPEDTNTVIPPERQVFNPSMTSADIRMALESQTEECVGRQVAAVAEQYKEFCQNPDSTNDYLTVKYDLNYHHYTLYYYDRAGNLTKTVSPEGVNRLLVKPADRNDTTNYTLATTYEYNTLKQQVKQNSPDGGATDFIYNNLGQLRFSRNERQEGDTSYSYSKYDYLGRITEVGESKLGGLAFANLDDDEYLLPDSVTEESHPYSNNTEQTWTIYSRPASWASYIGGKPQRFLQNRVSFTAARNKNGDTSYTAYSYDPHGNVEWLLQDIPGFSQAWTAYEYDLISGNVLKVKFNEHLLDKVYHRYSYDEDNRITSVETSRDEYVWDKDALYNYYAHGPLRRTELGQDKLQGTDYTYTIQGWLKAINTPNLKASEDPGQDGQGGQFAKDQFGMMLGYFEGDFNRTGSVLNAVSTNGYHLDDNVKNLFNGNISSWTSRTAAAFTDSMSGFAYRYDRLNRLKSTQFHTYGASSFASSGSYKEDFSYDANGNIMSMTRKAYGAGINMDDLDYHYYPNSNKLKRVTDTENSTTWNIDIDNQQDSNYVYDAIGNLIEDQSERIKIKWNVYGKVSEVIPVYEAGKHHVHIRFDYDPAGNRIRKEVNDSAFASGGVPHRLPESIRTTYYVRDASGNIMGIYERTNTEISGDTLYTANYKQIESPVYGSDRLGSWNADSLVASINFHIDDMDRISFSNIDNVRRETERDSTLAAFHVRENIKIGTENTFINGAHLKVKYNTNALLSTTGLASDTTFIGSLGNNVTIASDSSGTVQFYAVTAENYFGKANVLLVYDHDGNLMPGSTGIQSDSKAKAVSFAIPGSDKQYCLLTRGTGGKIHYAVINMNDPGNGSITGGAKGAVVKKDSITPPSGTSTFGRNFAVVEDRINEKVHVFGTAGKEDTLLIERITFDNEGEYQLSLQASLPGKDSLGQGELEISPDGKSLAVYNHLKRSGWFAHRKGQLAVFNLGYNFNLYGDKISSNADPVHSVTIPNVTLPKSSLAISKDGKHILFSQNSLTPMSTALNNSKAIWKYTKFTGEIALADSGKAGDIIRTIDNAYLSSKINGNRASGYEIDSEGDLTKTSYLASGDTLYAGYWPHENHIIRSAEAIQELMLARFVGDKRYELKDHLGNVRVIISDKKNGVDTTSDGQADYYTADVEGYYDYYSFGSLLPGRNLNPQNSRYKFNGKESDSEWNSGGAMYDYGFRIYDPRIAKFLSVDPLTKEYPWYTPYQFAGNTPIWCIDLDGAEELKYIDKFNTNTGHWYFDYPAAVNNAPINLVNSGISLWNSTVGVGKSIGNGTVSEDITQEASQLYDNAKQLIDNEIKYAKETPFVDALKDGASNLVSPEAVESYATGYLGGKLTQTASNVATKVPTSSTVKTTTTNTSTTNPSVKKIHANSKNSPKLTTLYRLEEASGKYLKTGVTSEKIPENRYSNAFMKDKVMKKLDQGSRSDMLKQERSIVEVDPGPLNKERWAGKAKKQ